MMMIYNSCCALVALGLFAGSEGAPNDYTIGSGTNPYAATVNAGNPTTLTVTGTYNIVQAYIASAYSQTFSTVSGTNQCNTDTVPSGVTPVPITASGTSLTTSFTLTPALLPAAVYTGPQTTDNTATTTIDESKTGVVLLCHTIQLKEGTLLMNEVKTIVKIELQLSATFNNAAITTVASSVLSGNTNLNLASGVTITPTVSSSQLRAGQPVTITLTASNYKLSDIPTAVLTGGSTTANILPTQDANVLRTKTCTNGNCVIELTLGFSFFTATAPTAYTLSGTATLDLSSNRRRLDSVSPPEVATFQVVLYVVPEDTQSSAGLTKATAAAAGGVMAVIAVVILL